MNRLKELRKEKGLTQQGLADEMEVSKRTYIYWENGESQIKPDKAQQLADYFGVSVGYLLGYDSERILPLGELFKHNTNYGTKHDGIVSLAQEDLVNILMNYEKEELRPVFIENIKQNLDELTTPDVELVYTLTERLLENKDLEKP